MKVTYIQQTNTMNSYSTSTMRLYDRNNHRLYINAQERERFLQAASHAEPQIRTLCLTLLFTGCRISEALSLTNQSIQAGERLIAIQSLKKRGVHHIREIPVPQELIKQLQSVHNLTTGPAEQPLWVHDSKQVNRITAYRWIKSVMVTANITGSQASPKGLRHGYGIHATRSGVQLNMLQKWMGHASMTTTAIYANAVGAEELEIADRMWQT